MRSMIPFAEMEKRDWTKAASGKAYFSSGLDTKSQITNHWTGARQEEASDGVRIRV